MVRFSGPRAKVDPDNASYHYALARALKRAGHESDAQAEFATTQQLRHRDLIQQNAEAANNAGITAATKGDLDTAIRELRRAIEQKPDLADAHYNLGGIYRQRGSFSDPS